MRMLVALVFALTAALIAVLLVSGPVANFALDQMQWERVEHQIDLFDGVFFGCVIFAAFVGWFVGWAVGRPFRRRSAKT